MLLALYRPICLSFSPAPGRTRYFKVRKQQSTSCWPAMALFFCHRQWIGHGRLAPQVRHKRSVLFAIDRAAARGGENSICQRPFPKWRVCEQKTDFCVALKSDMLTDGKVDWNIPDNFYFYFTNDHLVNVEIGFKTFIFFLFLTKFQW